MLSGLSLGLPEWTGPALPPFPFLSLSLSLAVLGLTGGMSIGEEAWARGLPLPEASPLARVLPEACAIPHLPHSPGLCFPY